MARLNPSSMSWRNALLVAALGSLVGLLPSANTFGHEPGWSYSPLPNEGDRAALGCDQEATSARFMCVAVRCEDDFSVGVYVHSSRAESDVGNWALTVDKEDRLAFASATDAPYGARFTADSDWLFDRFKYDTFVYLRHAEDDEAPFRYISLDGSLRAINRALYYCAPRSP